MKVFLSHYPGMVFVQARAEGDGIVGDMHLECRPGEGSFLGWTYEELRALAPGGHDLEDRRPRPLPEPPPRPIVS